MSGKDCIPGVVNDELKAAGGAWRLLASDAGAVTEAPRRPCFTCVLCRRAVMPSSDSDIAPIPCFLLSFAFPFSDSCVMRG